MKCVKLFLALPFVCLLGSCLVETPLKIPFQSYATSNLSDGWNISDPADENIDDEALKDIYRDVHNDDNLR